MIQEHVKQPLSEEILFGKLENGGLAVVDIEDDKLVIRTPEELSPSFERRFCLEVTDFSHPERFLTR